VEGYEPGKSFDEESLVDFGYADRGDEEAAVACLADLVRQAGGGPALELAIGTGRIALLLASTGVEVHGVDLSEAMVQRLRAQPGGEAIPVTMGDFADVPVEGEFDLVYVVFNTFHNLLTQDDQVRCFANVAEHLGDGGRFVIEAGVPSKHHRLENDQYVRAEQIDVDQVRLDVLKHDPAIQMIEETHVLLAKDQVRLNPVVQRYCWPSELDLMARLAGLRLVDRWGGWDRRPFTSASALHVSAFGR